MDALKTEAMKEAPESVRKFFRMVTGGLPGLREHYEITYEEETHATYLKRVFLEEMKLAVYLHPVGNEERGELRVYEPESAEYEHLLIGVFGAAVKSGAKFTYFPKE